MAHFANINDNNIVTQVIVIDNEYEDNGQEYINNVLNLPGKWLQCSYNTYEGKHLKDGVAIRKNYPSTGDTYSPEYDGFIPFQTLLGWNFNTDNWKWEPPIERPGDDFAWSETELKWIPTEEWTVEKDRVIRYRETF